MMILILFSVIVLLGLFFWIQGVYKSRQTKNPLSGILDAEPDAPVSFGYKTCWIAVRHTNPADVFQALNKHYGMQINPLAANWVSGLRAANQGDASFITPPIGDWILIVNPHFRDISEDRTRHLMQTLSAQFGEAQFFGNHRVSGYGAFGLYRQGVCVRALSIADLETLLREGDVSDAEKQIIKREHEQNPDQVPYFLENNNESIFGDEACIMEMAAQWSLNPQTLSDMHLAGTGLCFGDGRFDTW